MEGEFKLEISLGNDAMQNERHVGEAVMGVGEAVKNGRMAGSVRDVNGNTVGTYWFEDPEREQVTDASRYPTHVRDDDAADRSEALMFETPDHMASEPETGWNR